MSPSHGWKVKEACRYLGCYKKSVVCWLGLTVGQAVCVSAQLRRAEGSVFGLNSGDTL